MDAGSKWPLKFEVIKRCETTKAKSSRLTLPHSVVETPVFMPVGTQGTMKGILPFQLEEIDCRIILANTYHLGMRPGPETLTKAGHLHKFMNWNRSLLTDSGGFQMVSLVELSYVTEEGVSFKSPYDSKEIMLSPEKSIEIQNAIGADIMMQLDDVVHSTTTGPRVKEAMERSIRWLDRCLAAHKRPTEQNIFPIIQGGLDLELRTECIQEMVKRKAPGYAIGGLSGGEDKNLFWKVVSHCTNHLPKDKPIYLMGVGYSVDLVVCSALGVDMFDCVFPTRTARFGTALIRTGQLHLKNKKYADDFNPIDSKCLCRTCETYTRAYLHSIVTKESVSCHLISIHNLYYQMQLMKDVRKCIEENKFPEFVRNFMKGFYENDPYPQWAIDALEAVNIKLN